ncbi:MAG: hypothetical protein ABIQ40_10385 [Bacteroidia bacterium]
MKIWSTYLICIFVSLAAFLGLIYCSPYFYSLNGDGVRIFTGYSVFIVVFNFVVVALT